MGASRLAMNINVSGRGQHQARSRSGVPFILVRDAGGHWDSAGHRCPDLSRLWPSCNAGRNTPRHAFTLSMPGSPHRTSSIGLLLAGVPRQALTYVGYSPQSEAFVMVGSIVLGAFFIDELERLGQHERCGP